MGKNANEKTDLWENPKTALYMSGGSEDPLPGKEESESTGPTSETPPPEGSGSKDAGSGDDFPLNEETYRKIPDRFKQAPESSRPPVSKRPDSGKAKSEGGNPPPPPFKGGKQPTSGTHYPRGRVSPFLMVLLVAGIVWMFVSARKESRTTLISWNGFYEQLEKGNIDTVTLKGNILSGTFVAPPEIDSDPGKLLPEPVFHSTADPEDADRWIIHPVTVPRRDADYTFTTSDRPVPYFLVVIDKKKGSSTEKAIYRKFRCEVPATALTDPNLDNTLRQKVRSFTSHSPIDNTGLYMITSSIVEWFSFAHLLADDAPHQRADDGGGIGGIMKSPMRSYDPNKNKRVTFADVAGLDNVKKELEEIVDYLKDPERTTEWARVPKGSLLCGPPGTGKLSWRVPWRGSRVSFLSIQRFRIYADVRRGRRDARA